MITNEKKNALNKIAVAFLCSELEYELSVGCDTCLNLSELFNLNTECESTCNTDCIIRYHKLLKAIEELVKEDTARM